MGAARLPRLSAEQPVVGRRKAKVLIVGAGLTGCLTSYLLRKQCGDSIDLQVLERSAYPSGRFGAGLRFNTTREGEGKWADMGSQVVMDISAVSAHFSISDSLF